MADGAQGIKGGPGRGRRRWYDPESIKVDMVDMSASAAAAIAASKIGDMAAPILAPVGPSVTPALIPARALQAPVTTGVSTSGGRSLVSTTVKGTAGTSSPTSNQPSQQRAAPAKASSPSLGSQVWKAALRAAWIGAVITLVISAVWNTIKVFTAKNDSFSWKDAVTHVLFDVIIGAAGAAAGAALVAVIAYAAPALGGVVLILLSIGAAWTMTTLLQKAFGGFLKSWREEEEAEAAPAEPKKAADVTNEPPKSEDKPVTRGELRELVEPLAEILRDIRRNQQPAATTQKAPESAPKKKAPEVSPSAPIDEPPVKLAPPC
ncbi:MAG: hypothetical protein R3C68_00040 [Myxococcota bacterium]